MGGLVVTPAAAGTLVPSLLAYPHYPANAWQDIMYRDALASGWQFEALDCLAALDNVEAAGSVLHLGWTAPIAHNATTVREALAAVATAKEQLARFRQRGGRIIWTIHNVLPHEVEFLIPALELCRAFADAADVVHVMASATGKLVRPYYSLEGSRVERIPHPSYAGIYPSTESRAQAREALGIAQDVTLALATGTIRPYKGVDRLIALSQQLPQGVELAIVGQFSGGLDPNEARATAGQSCRIVDGYQDGESLARWCSAADVMLLPYTGSLNSGTIELAATFGLPAIVPPLPTFADFDSRWVRVVDFDNDVPGTISAISELAATPTAAAAARRHASANSPDTVSAAFLQVLASLTERAL